MKRIVVLLIATCMLPVAHAQGAQEGPAQAPSQNVQMQTDGRCMDVKPGDTVHYDLTIQSVEKAKAVLADLRLRQGGAARLDTSGGLPPMDFRNLGGGGAGVRDAHEPAVYHFVFKVPVAIYGGVYRGVGVIVTTDEEVAMRDEDRVDVSRHTRDEIAHYCLNVISSFGIEGRPEVTNFKPGPVDAKK